MGYTCHIAVTYLRHANFENHVISHGTDFPDPSHTSELTPPDVYILDMLKKAILLVNPPATISELSAKIVTFVRAVKQLFF